MAMTIGVLMLDTHFERFPGDIGNPASFGSTPVLFERVPAATARRIVGLSDASFAEPFVAAGKRLIASGATAITTSCGFLVLYQDVLARQLNVPVATSALLMLPMLARALPAGRLVGVVTFSAESLTAQHLIAAGAAIATPIEGLSPGCSFQRAIYEEPVQDSIALREADAVSAAVRLNVRYPRVAAIVLECTNLPPHRAAIEQATGLPVYDIFDTISAFLGIKVRHLS